MSWTSWRQHLSALHAPSQLSNLHGLLLRSVLFPYRAAHRCLQGRRLPSYLAHDLLSDHDPESTAQPTDVHKEDASLRLSARPPLRSRHGINLPSKQEKRIQKRGCRSSWSTSYENTYSLTWCFQNTNSNKLTWNSWAYRTLIYKKKT